MWNDPFEEMRRFRKEMNRLFDAFFEKGPLFTEKGISMTEMPMFRQPLFDMRETDSELIASIEIPGVDKKDIQLNITENNLEVKAEKKQETKMEKEGYLKEERSYKGFYRSVPLPCKIIPEQARATYKDGVLEVIMPKAEKKKIEKARKIEIQ